MLTTKRYQGLYDHFNKFIEQDQAKQAAQYFDFNIEKALRGEDISLTFFTTFNKKVIEILLPGLLKELDSILPTLEQKLIHCFKEYKIEGDTINTSIKECLTNFRENIKKNHQLDLEAQFTSYCFTELMHKLSNNYKSIVDQMAVAYARSKDPISHVRKELLSPINKKYDEARKFVVTFLKEDLEQLDKILEKPMSDYEAHLKQLKARLSEKLAQHRTSFEEEYNRIVTSEDQNVLIMQQKIENLKQSIAMASKLDDEFKLWLLDKPASMIELFNNKYPSIKQSAINEFASAIIFARAKRNHNMFSTQNNGTTQAAQNISDAKKLTS